MKPKLNQSAKDAPQIDQCQTPAYALTPMLPYLPKDVPVWEPAYGQGYLGREMERHGYMVIKGDILLGNDFFRCKPKTPRYRIFTNPPYSTPLKVNWLERCYELGNPFALLVPTETISMGSVQVLMEKYGAEIMLLNRRVDFKMPVKGWGGTAQFPVLWLCWKMLPAPLVYGHISLDQKREHKLQVASLGVQERLFV